MRFFKYQKNDVKKAKKELVSTKWSDQAYATHLMAHIEFNNQIDSSGTECLLCEKYPLPKSVAIEPGAEDDEEEDDNEE